MRIQYVEPLSRGISRMKKDLFNPFDLKKWFVIGFTAFLAGFGEFQSSGVPSSSWRRRGSNINFDDLFYFPQRAWEWLGNHPGWAIIIGFAVLFGFIIGIILTWLSSRGKFIFLDNVVRGRAKVVAPWYEYRKEGNSFFLWNLCWGLIVLAIVIAYLFYCFVSLQALYESGRNVRAIIFPLVLAGVGFLFITVITSFVFVLLRDFVVPIMYRDRITTLEAVQKFAGLFSSEFIYFVGYGLFILALSLVIGVGIIIAGCGTCCVGFVILAIPYINAVILLPITYAIRAFSVEFLEQFGPEYEVFPKPDVNPPQALTI